MGRGFSTVTVRLMVQSKDCIRGVIHAPTSKFRQSDTRSLELKALSKLE
jgi:hypothetical protein